MLVLLRVNKETSVKTIIRSGRQNLALEYWALALFALSYLEWVCFGHSHTREGSENGAC